MDTFYSHDKIEKKGIKNDHIYFDKLLGIEDGFCESLTIPDGERIKAIMVYSSNNVIRNLEFKLSDGTMKKFGKHMDYTGAGRQEIVNFSHGEELLGVFGETKSVTIKNEGRGNYRSAHFVSMGFIVNMCDTFKVSQFASKMSGFKTEETS